MLLFTEGFDWSTAIADYITYVKWGDRSSSSIGNTSGLLRFGASSGNYIAFNGANDYIRRPIGQNLAAGVIGHARRLATSGTGLYRHNLITLWDTTATFQMGLISNNDLSVSVIRTNWSTVLGTSAANVIIPDTWHYIEFKWKISDSIGGTDVIVYIDGTAVLTLAAASDTKNSANAYATHYGFGGNSPAITTSIGNAFTYMDDHYLFDLTGSLNNAPIGSLRIQTLFPNGDGNSSQFVGSDGNSTNNSLLVDDPTTNTTDYVESGTVGNKDTYAFGDTVATTTLVYGVVPNYVAIRTDTNPRSIAPVVRSGGTDYDGSNIALNATYTNHQQIYETNPATSSAFTKSEIDAAEFGMKVTV